MKRFRDATTKMYDDILQGGATKKSVIFEPPFGRARSLVIFCVASSLTMALIVARSRALNLTKERLAQTIWLESFTPL